jgi:hypothetical protein
MMMKKKKKSVEVKSKDFDGCKLKEFEKASLNPKRESNSERNNENEIVRNVLKKRFFERLVEYNLDLDTIANGKRNRNEQFHMFNLFLKEMYEKRFLMTDMFYFLEEDVFDVKTALSCFNEDNTCILREELAIKHHKTQRKSNLELLIDDD